MILALFQQAYSYQDAQTIWEALRVWLNAEPLPGWRFTPFWSNAIMLVTVLVFIFLLELLLTIGIQVWERRVLARMQRRRGPSFVGDITATRARRVIWPLVILLAIPAVLYGIEYWTAILAVAGPIRIPYVALFIAVACIAVICLELYYRKQTKAGQQKLIRVVEIAGLVIAAVVLLARRFSNLWVSKAINDLSGAIEQLGAFELRVPAIIWPGGLLGYVTVGCTFLAFAIYLIYVFGYYWRQGLADTLKIFSKEDIVPLNADRLLFTMAPILVYVPALLSWIVIPFGVAVIGGHYCYYMVQDLNVGLLLIIADFALFLVAIIMSGYASNNKYALVGAMREAAMLLTYEVPMLMSLLCVALFAGSLNLTEIVQRQTMTWAILPLLPAFVIYFVIALAETNRPPFDLPEAQNELLGGYIVEYSGLRFALFYVAEYSNVFIVSAIMTVCFFGGWKGPMFLGPDGLWLTSLFWFLVKTYIFVYFFIWARATMPRIRIDQIMYFSWKFLLPASVAALAITAVGVVYRHPWFNANRIWDSVLYRYHVVPTREALTMLTAAERAFFWGYAAVTLLFVGFILWLAWRVLFVRRAHPLRRREVTWS